MFIYGSNQYIKVMFDNNKPYLCYRDMVGRWLRIVDIRVSRYAKMDTDLLSVCIGAGIEIPESAKYLAVLSSPKCNYDAIGIKVNITLNTAWLVVKYNTEWIPVHPYSIYSMALKT